MNSVRYHIDNASITYQSKCYDSTPEVYALRLLRQVQPGQASGPNDMCCSDTIDIQSALTAQM
jgi:hypothetical protein